MTDDEGMLQIAAAWSIVHGVANLLIANRIGFRAADAEPISPAPWSG